MTGVRPDRRASGQPVTSLGGERRASHFDAYTRALTESNTYAVSVIPASRNDSKGREYPHASNWTYRLGPREPTIRRRRTSPLTLELTGCSHLPRLREFFSHPSQYCVLPKSPIGADSKARNLALLGYLVKA